MNAAITEAPTGTTMILRALARFPDRTAFAWDDGSPTYRATFDLIGRLQAAMVAAGLAKGQTVAFLSANSAETWCAGVAASGLGLITTWLHPLGARADHLEVIEDAEASALIVDPKTHAQRGGELAAKAADRLAVVLTMGRADFGRDVLAAAEKIGTAAPQVMQYDQAGNILTETDSNVETDYVFLDGMPVSAIKPSTAAVSALHTDNIGTVQRATNASKATVWTGNYFPCGAVAPTASITMNLRFPGMYNDTTGFYYNGFRDFDTSYCRYLEVDPIGLGAGPNPAFVPTRSKLA